MLRQSYRPGQVYLEPFCGGAWVTVETYWFLRKGLRLATDASQDLILLWQALQKGWEPPDQVPRELYQELRHAQPSALRGFVGFGCSWGGVFFGGYAQDSPQFRGTATERDFVRGAKDSLLRKVPYLQDVVFEHRDYRDHEPKDCLIYCDPPYRGTRQYPHIGDFNSTAFWRIMREWATVNTVFISEYEAPDDFIPVWRVPVKLQIAEDRKDSRIEYLFTYKG